MIAAFSLPRLPADPLLFKEQHALNSKAEGTIDIRCQAKCATPDGLNTVTKQPAAWSLRSCLESLPVVRSRPDPATSKQIFY